MDGAILEKYVVVEIMKTYLNSGKGAYMYYYRDKDAKEIDIVLEHDGVLNPIEIKKTSNPGTEAAVSGVLGHRSCQAKRRSRIYLLGAYACVCAYLIRALRRGCGALPSDNKRAFGRC